MVIAQQSFYTYIHPVQPQVSHLELKMFDLNDVLRFTCRKVALKCPLSWENLIPSVQRIYVFDPLHDSAQFGVLVEYRTVVNK